MINEYPRVHDPCTIESSLHGLDGLQNLFTRAPRRVILADGVMMCNSTVVLSEKRYLSVSHSASIVLAEVARAMTL